MCDLMEIWDDEKNIFFHTWAHSGGGGEIIELHNIYPWKKTFFWVMELKNFRRGTSSPPPAANLFVENNIKKNGGKGLIKASFLGHKLQKSLHKV